MTKMAEARIVKSDAQQNLVFGWANVAIEKTGEQIVDRQQHVIDIEDLEMAAYLFNLAFRQTGEMHQGEALGSLVESLVVTPEKLIALGLEEDALPCGWWVGFHIPDDAIFAKIVSGEYQMFSIQGRAVMEEVTVNG